MFKSNSKLRSLIAVVAILGIAGTFWFGDIAYAYTGESDRAITSVWDQETESFDRGVEVTVYRSPSCGCCGKWMKHMQKHGFEIQDDIKTENMAAIKLNHKVPQQLASCHTAIIDGYVMEGHIPADDIKRFLASSPKEAGLAVPGMVLGTPGMEAAKKQPFTVTAFDLDGKVKVFQEYQTY